MQIHINIRPKTKIKLKITHFSIILPVKNEPMQLVLPVCVRMCAFFLSYTVVGLGKETVGYGCVGVSL